MKNEKENGEQDGQNKGDKVKRVIALASGGLMLWHAVKNRKLIEGLGAGLLIYQGVTGKRLLKTGLLQLS
jgi:hypothetical protein